MKLYIPEVCYANTVATGSASTLLAQELDAGVKKRIAAIIEAPWMYQCAGEIVGDYEISYKQGISNTVFTVRYRMKIPARNIVIGSVEQAVDFVQKKLVHSGRVFLNEASDRKHRLFENRLFLSGTQVGFPDSFLKKSSPVRLLVRTDTGIVAAIFD